jgi:hypothetical protein
MAREIREGWRSIVPWPSAATIARWHDETSWWLTPEGRRRPRALLAELLESMAGRFAGRRLRFELAGRSVRLTLDDVRIDPGPDGKDAPAAPDGADATPRQLDDAPERVVIDVSEVVIDEAHVGTVSAVVLRPRLEFEGTAEVVTGPVDLAVATTRAAVVQYLRGTMPDWRMQPRAGDLVAIRPPKRRLTVLIRPELDGPRTVRAHVVGVLLFQREVSIPRPFRPVRKFEIPWTETELELVETTLDGDEVRVTLRHTGIRHAVRLEDLRTAVRDGVLVV